MQVERKCPECGALNSLVVDYQRGEVVCEECGIVTEMALLEDQGTAFEVEGNAVMHDDVASGGRDPNGGPRDATEKKLAKCRQLLRLLQTKLFVPEAVTDMAVDYCTRICRITRDVSGAVSSSQYKPSVMAISAFLLAAPKFQHPIQAEEIFNIPQIREQIKPSQVNDMKRQMVELLNLRAEQMELSQRIWSEYVDMLHRRMVAYGRMVMHNNNSNTTQTGATGGEGGAVDAAKYAAILAAHFEDHVTSGFSVQKICAASIILTYTADTALRAVFADGSAPHPFAVGGSVNGGNSSSTGQTVTIQQAPHDAELIEKVTHAVIESLRTDAAETDVRNLMKNHLSDSATAPGGRGGGANTNNTSGMKRRRLLAACTQKFTEMKAHTQYGSSGAGSAAAAAPTGTGAAGGGMTLKRARDL